MSQFMPYLSFDGNCADAMRFYQSVLGGELQLMPMGESPIAADLPPGAGSRIMHASISLDGGVLMASDSMPGMPFEAMKGVAVTLAYKDVEKGRSVFNALVDDGGQVTMPYDKTFWASGFGMLVDRFGTSWMVNVE